MEKERLFLRKATGLVRSWSLLDAFAFNAGVHPMALSFYAFSLAIFWPQASLIPAIVLGLIFTSIQGVVYAMLVSAMPRAGGEYVWISRILSPVIGFTVVLVGWVVALIMWFPIFINLLAYQFFMPVSVLIGNLGLAFWWLTPEGLFTIFLFLLVIGGILIIAGMKWCGRAFSAGYIATMFSTIVFFVVFSVFSHTDFINGYNAFSANNFGITNAYQQVLNTAAQAGLPSSPFLSANWSLAFITLVPLLAFANSWSMWGAPLYGEVKGSSELKRGISSMVGSNVINTLLALIALGLTVRVVGYQFFQSANMLWWNQSNTMPLFPYPPFLAFPLTGSAAIASIIIIPCFGFLLVACSLEILLPAIRILFAMAFDRSLPAPLAALHARKIPLVSFMVVAGIGILFTGLWSFFPPFRVIFLDATVGAIISFFFAAITAIVFPFTLPRVFKASPASKYYIGKVPVLSLLGTISAGYFLFLIVRWAQDPLYGVNNLTSAIYFAIVYIGAILLYLFNKWYRKKQGIDLNLVFKEIPVE